MYSDVPLVNRGDTPESGCVLFLVEVGLSFMHFRLLRTACKDYYYKKSRTKLTDICKHAGLREWTNTATGSKVLKIIRDQRPKPLLDLLDSALVFKPRKPGLGKFFDNSKSKWGYQLLQNRLAMMGDVHEGWLYRHVTDDKMIILLKIFF